MDSPSLTVARLDPADAGELLTLRRAAYAHLAVRNPEHAGRILQQVDDVRRELRELPDGGSLVLGGRLEGRLVASIAIVVHGSAATLARFAVAPDLQHQGIGRQLIAAVPPALPAEVREIRVEPLPGTDPGPTAAGGAADEPSIGELMAAYVRSVGE